jgi:hypothetical protein
MQVSETYGAKATKGWPFRGRSTELPEDQPTREASVEDGMG